jgi:hypothetical protein
MLCYGTLSASYAWTIDDAEDEHLLNTHERGTPQNTEGPHPK